MTQPVAALLAVALAGAVSGCGLDVRLPDLFAITRTGTGPRITLVVNDGGGIRCNGGPPKMVTNAQLITLRDLKDSLAPDATSRLSIPPGPGTVYYYRVKLEQGTIAFPDRAAATHRYLGQVEAFVLRAAHQFCGLSG